MKKQIKQTKGKSDLAEFRDEIIRHFDVVIEHQDKKLDLIAEQYLSIDTRLDNVEKVLDIHTGKFSEIGMQFSDIDMKFSKIDMQFSGIGAKFKEIEIELREIKADLKSALLSEKAKKMNQRRISALEKRVATLEKRK